MLLLLFGIIRISDVSAIPTVLHERDKLPSALAGTQSDASVLKLAERIGQWSMADENTESENHSVSDRPRPIFREAPDSANGPEVAGTSFPLLSTVLAGFAITIAVQVILHPVIEDPSSRVVIALIAFLLGTLMFVSSIGFSLNAQANNYLPFLDLGPTAARLMNVEDHSSWIRRMVQRWAIYFAASLLTFYVGIALLLAGLNLVVWEFAGGWIALVLLAAILLNLMAVIYLQRNIDRFGSEPDALSQAGLRQDDDNEFANNTDTTQSTRGTDT